MTQPNTPNDFGRGINVPTKSGTLDEQIDDMFPTWFKKLQVTFSGELPLSQDDRQQVLVVPYSMFKTALVSLFTEHSKQTEAEIFEDEITFGNHIIPKDWEKIENVYIWFEAFHKGIKWRGIPGFVYKRPDGTFVAPFRGELLEVIHDTKNEYREIAQLKRNKGEDSE